MLDPTALVNERISNWTVGGYDVNVEAQNSFQLRGKSATLAGRPDIIARREDAVAIVDVKTAHESPSHVVLVMIYLYAVPRALERYRNAKLRGQVTYRDHTVRIPAEAVDEEFIQNLGRLIRRLSAAKPARRVSSRQECASATSRPRTVRNVWTSSSSQQVRLPQTSEPARPIRGCSPPGQAYWAGFYRC